MPEGDSVHRLAARLRQVDGARIASGELRSGSAAGRALRGVKVLGHDTHGKHLLTRFDDDTTLHTHLRMQGSWTITGVGRRLPARVAATARVRMRLDDDRTVWGIDLPVVELLPAREEHRAVGHLGPDPLRDDFDADEAVRRLTADPGLTLRAGLLDQRRIAGLGNLWANELGFLVGARPDRPLAEVDVPALVLRAARMLRHSATTPEAYQVTTGRRQRGQSHWVVGRAGRPCLRCGTTVLARDEHGFPGSPPRRAWWCPSCQR